MQVTFYVMVMSDAPELGVLRETVAEVLKSTMEDQNWFSFEIGCDIHKMQLIALHNPLKWRLCPWLRRALGLMLPQTMAFDSLYGSILLCFLSFLLFVKQACTPILYPLFQLCLIGALIDQMT